MLHKTSSYVPALILCTVLYAAGQKAVAQTQPGPTLDQQTTEKLLNRLAADEARIKDLEERLNQQTGAALPPSVAPAGQTVSAAASTPAPPASAAAAVPPAQTAQVQTAQAQAAAPPAAPDTSSAINAADADAGGHTMEMPGGGPNLTVRGYLDFNFGVGSDANPLIFPMGVPPHSGFQVGELALMASSQLSEKLSFMSELVIGSDPTN